MLVVAAVPAAAQLPPGALQAVPPGSPLPRVLPAQPPPVALPTLPGRPARGAGAGRRTSRITSVAVEGVTAYPRPAIAALAQGLVGPAVPLAKIEAARQAILQRYRGDGYVLSTVSASIDAAGALRFVVTEGRIASVKLSRDIGPAGVQVLRFLKRLTEQTPIDEATLERYLLLAQDVPGVTLHAVLQPSTEEPGALNLIAEVSRAPVSGLVTTDNYASTYTGPIESLLVANLNSFTAVRRADPGVAVPHLAQQPDLRAGLDRGVPRRFRPASCKRLWRRRHRHADRHAGRRELPRHHHRVRCRADLSGDPLRAADAEPQPQLRRGRYRHQHRLAARQRRFAARRAGRRQLRRAPTCCSATRGRR